MFNSLDCSLIDIYWDLVGHHFSTLVGRITDAVPICFTEILSELFLVSATGCMVLFIRYRKTVKTPFLFFLPASVIVISILPLAPTYYRTPLSHQASVTPITKEELEVFIYKASKILKMNFDDTSYRSLTADSALMSINASYDILLPTMGFPRGRHVSRIKRAWGTCKLYGLTFSKIAFHNPITREVIFLSDYPIDHSWYVKSLAHEVAHARGFMREADAEVWAFLCLIRSDNPALKSIGYIEFIRKSHFRYHEKLYPDIFLSDWKEKYDAREHLMGKLLFVRLFKKIICRTEIQQTTKKLASAPVEILDYNNDYFTTIMAFEKKIGTLFDGPDTPPLSPRNGTYSCPFGKDE